MGLLIAVFILFFSFTIGVFFSILAASDFDSPAQDVLSKISDPIDEKSAIRLYLYGDSYSVLKRFKKLNRKMSKNEQFEQPLVKELEVKWVLRNLFNAPFEKKKIANSPTFNVDTYRNYIESIKKMYLVSFENDNVVTLEMFDKYSVGLYIDCLYKNIKNIFDNKKKREFVDYAYKILESTYSEDDMIYPTCLNQIYIAKKLIDKDSNAI